MKVIAEMVLAPEDQAGRRLLEDVKDLDLEGDVVRLRIRSLRARYMMHLETDSYGSTYREPIQC